MNLHKGINGTALDENCKIGPLGPEGYAQIKVDLIGSKAANGTLTPIAVAKDDYLVSNDIFMIPKSSFVLGFFHFGEARIPLVVEAAEVLNMESVPSHTSDEWKQVCKLYEGGSLSGATAPAPHIYGQTDFPAAAVEGQPNRKLNLMDYNKHNLVFRFKAAKAGNVNASCGVVFINI